MTYLNFIKLPLLRFKFILKLNKQKYRYDSHTLKNLKFEGIFNGNLASYSIYRQLRSKIGIISMFIISLKISHAVKAYKA